MTAVPVPPLSRLAEKEEKDMFETAAVKKDLTSAFATPAVVRKKITRLSRNFQQLPAEYIKVFLRLRPFTEEELKSNEDRQCMKISDDRHILTAMAPKDSKMFKASNRGIGEPVRHYTFTKIFDSTAGQEEFYQETAHPLVQQFIDGNDALVFTYGVTNAGKTYTLQGTPGKEGIIPQSIQFLFDQIGGKLLENVTFVPKMARNLYSIDDSEIRSRESIKGEVMSMFDEARLSFGQKSQQRSLGSSLVRDSTEASIDADAASGSKGSSKESFGNQTNGPVKFAVFVSFVEVYRELVYDLLVPVTDDKRRTRPVLVIADDKKGTSYVKGMREIQVNSPEEVLKVLSAGQSNLHVAATKLNKDSSRSHCIFTITLVQVMDIPDPHGGRVSKISFCDLAGSERANKTGEAGDRLKEAGKINTSLMKLGMCIADIRHNQRYKDDKTKQRAVFFRESKLTRLFRNYLLGDGCACMIVNANMCASGFDETAHVLKFSALAKEVQIINKPRQMENRKRSRATLTDEKFETLIEASKNTRNTIAWEKKLTPVKDEREEEEDSDLEEGSEEEESDSESGDEEQAVESDVSFWKNREEKYLRMIEKLKTAVLEERKKKETIEKTVRDQCAQFMRNQIVKIEQRHQEGVEETMDVLLEEQQTRLQVMANLSNINMKELKEGFDKKFWELTSKNTAIEKELNECRELANTKTAEFLASAEELTLLKVGHGELKIELEKKTAELVTLKRRRSRASSRLSLGNYEKDEAIQDLMKENEEGKILIRSLMEETEDYRSQVESTQEECEKLREELNLAHKMIEEKGAEKVIVSNSENDKLLKDLKEKFEEKEEAIQLLENKTQEVLKDRRLFADEIVISDEEKVLKFTEGLLQHLPEILDRKEEQITQLTTDIEKEIEDKLSIKERFSSLNSDFEKATTEASLLRENQASTCEELKKLQAQKAEAEVLHSRQRTDADNKCNALKESHAKLVETLKSQLKNKEETMSAKILQAEERIKEKEKEVAEKEMFEEKLLKETDRLHSEVGKLMKENLEVKQVSLKRSSDASERLQEVELLTQDRDDLRTRLDTLRKKLVDVTKEKEKLQEELREAIANNTTVQNTTELMELRSSLSAKDVDLKKLESEKDDLAAEKDDLKKEIEKVRKIAADNDEKKGNELSCALAENERLETEKSELEQAVKDHSSETARLEKDLESANQKHDELQEEIKKGEELLEKLQTDAVNAGSVYKTEKDALLERMKETEDNMARLQKTVKDLEKENDTNKELGKNSDQVKSDLEENLSEKQEELEQVQASFSEFKAKTKERIDEERRNFEVEMKSVKQLHGKEMKQLQSELMQSKHAVSTKEKELNGFRENRDKIVKALEVQISNDRETNRMLKENLDEHMADVTKLKNEKSAALLENEEIRKLLEEKKSGISQMRKSQSEAVLPQFSPKVQLVPLSSDAQTESPPQKRGTAKVDLPDETISEAAASEEETSVKKTRRAKGTRGVARRGSSRAFKKGRRVTRAATPLPEVLSGDDEEVSSPPKKLRSSSRFPKQEKTTNLMSEIEEGGVLDDSELLKETGNARQFPRPTMEIDVTPNLSKKAMKTRKRAVKKEEQEPGLEPADAGAAVISRSTRRKVRGNNNLNTNNNAAGSKISDDETPLSSASKNLAKVGSMIKNSPVGQVFKAISPAGSSPKKSSRRAPDDQKRTKRLVRLHPDDISSPLEATPTPDPGSEFSAVSHTPARKLRNLRDRKKK